MRSMGSCVPLLGASSVLQSSYPHVLVSGICDYGRQERSLILPIGLLLFVFALSVHADVNDDIGLTQLQYLLGSGTPNGSGVAVSLVEANVAASGDPIYLPDLNDAQFSGKTIIDRSSDASGQFSVHATESGRLFFGNSTSIAPGITNVDAYLATHWIGDGYLHAGLRGVPASSASRIANNSWVGTVGSRDGEILSRIDWLTNRDELISVVAMNNGSNNWPLLGSAFNVIAVGRTDGNHATGSVAIDSLYSAGRTRPDIVAPRSSTSAATPTVASAVALLVDQGHNNPALSQGSTTNRNGDVIYNAERSEVIKASLMAGASRHTSNTTSSDITDYRGAPDFQSDNGLDTRYGAGQLNIFNSYRILAGGEQNSQQDGGGWINNTGFDYDPFFGGLGENSNDEAYYLFSTGDQGARLSASLVWNLDFELTRTDPDRYANYRAVFRDLDLFLYDGTGTTQFASSMAERDNSENLWFPLAARTDYQLTVALGDGQFPFEGDYALAWQVAPVPLPASVWLMGTALVCLGFMRSRQPSPS